MDHETSHCKKIMHTQSVKRRRNEILMNTGSFLPTVEPKTGLKITKRMASWRYIPLLPWQKYYMYLTVCVDIN